MSEEYAKVYKSFDYDKFKFLEANREVKKAQVLKIANSIDQVGYIIPSPIIVNEDLEIIDGQGRFTACKEKGLPIYYVISTGAGVRECIAMNIGQKNWTTNDYIRSYAARGNTSYVLLQRILSDFPMFFLDVIMGVITNRIITNGWGTHLIKEGQLSLTPDQYEDCEQKLAKLQEFLPIINRIPGSQRVKQSAVSWVLSNTNCDAQRLNKKMNERYVLFAPVVDREPLLFLSQLTDVYNHKLAKNNCVYFDTAYKQFLKD